MSHHFGMAVEHLERAVLAISQAMTNKAFVERTPASRPSWDAEFIELIEHKITFNKTWA